MVNFCSITSKGIIMLILISRIANPALSSVYIFFHSLSYLFQMDCLHNFHLKHYNFNRSFKIVLVFHIHNHFSLKFQTEIKNTLLNCHSVQYMVLCVFSKISLSLFSYMKKSSISKMIHYILRKFLFAIDYCSFDLNEVFRFEKNHYFAFIIQVSKSFI